MAGAEPDTALPLPTLSFDAPNPILAIAPDDVIEFALPYLSIKDVVALKTCSKSLNAVSSQHAPDHLSLVKLALSSEGPSTRIFAVYGATLHSLSLQRVTTASDPLAIARILAKTPHLRKASGGPSWGRRRLSAAGRSPRAPPRPSRLPDAPVSLVACHCRLRLGLARRRRRRRRRRPVLARRAAPAVRRRPERRAPALRQPRAAPRRAADAAKANALLAPRQREHGGAARLPLRALLQASLQA